MICVERVQIGLTGGIGCGKSTALKLFADRGFGVVDCDGIVHELLAGDRPVLDEIREVFGEGVISATGGVDRARLGQLVFGRPELLTRLEEILHPRVRERWERAISAGGDWVVEVPLLFEKNLQNKVDITVCVFCHPDLQVERLEGRGVSRSQALTRMNRQMALSEKAERADYVLLNDGTKAFLAEQVDHLLLQLKTCYV